MEDDRIAPASTFSGSGYQPFLQALYGMEDERRAARKNVYRLLAVDPGGFTGLSCLYVGRKSGRILWWAETLLANDEMRQVRDVADVVDFLAAQGPEEDLRLAVEDFRSREVNTSEEFLSPVRIGRRLEGVLSVTHPKLAQRIQWYMPARKAEFRDDRLKALGLYTPGPDHRRDATRHALILRKYVLEESGI